MSLINYDIKKDGRWNGEHEGLLADEILLRLDPYDQDYISVRMISDDEIGVFVPGEGDAEECVYSRLVGEP